MHFSEYATPEKIAYAKQLREKATPAELRAFAYLKGRTPSWGFQVPVGGYIADFCCPRWNLILEVDGSSHKHRKRYDKQRDKHLAALGWETIRMTNAEVFHNTRQQFWEKIVLASLEWLISQNVHNRGTL